MIDIDSLHNELLSILLVIDAFCKENNIEYSLFAGTLLGAVRHQGFIPWDDDIDICMSRQQYELFFQCWEKKHPRGFFLQNNDTDPEWTQPFAKIRKDNSTYIEYEFQKALTHTGIYIDIFPLDRMLQGKVYGAVDYVEWSIYLFCIKQLWNRFSFRKGERVWCLPADNLGKKYVHWFRTILIKRCSQKNLPIANVEGKKRIRNYVFSSDLLDGFSELVFEGYKFPAISHWDKYLKEVYGEYMKLPPLDERTWTHRPLVMSIDQSFQDYERGYGES